MMIIGCDFHPCWQQVSWLDTETGETGERKLVQASGDAERFYRQLQVPSLIGMEATGNCHWLVGTLPRWLTGVDGKVRYLPRMQRHWLSGYECPSAKARCETRSRSRRSRQATCFRIHRPPSLELYRLGRSLLRSCRLPAPENQKGRCSFLLYQL
jgi:hypothetical protein